MSLSFDPRNIIALGQKIFTGRHTQGPPAKPFNVGLGGTGGGPNNYGAPRNVPVFRDPNDLRQWSAPGSGTSQDRHTTTRLPGDRR